MILLLFLVFSIVVQVGWFGARIVNGQITAIDAMLCAAITGWAVGALLQQQGIVP